MELNFEPIKNQTFEIGRTINPLLCNCIFCDFLHCPKHNYAPKMKRVAPTIDSFWNAFSEDILMLNHPNRWMYSFHNLFKLKLNYRLITEFFDMFINDFPKHIYWGLDDCENNSDEIEENIYNTIQISEVINEEVLKASINIPSHTVTYEDSVPDAKIKKLVTKILSAFDIIVSLIFTYYEDADKDWCVGWLSREGRFYPCKSGEHSLIAKALGFSNEERLETYGWVKTVYTDTYFGPKKLSAEQCNWLSEHGFEIENKEIEW